MNFIDPYCDANAHTWDGHSTTECISEISSDSATMRTWNIPWSVDTALEGVLGAERLGFWFDGRVWVDSV